MIIRHDIQEFPNISPLGFIHGFSKKSLPRLATTNILEKELISMELNCCLLKDRSSTGIRQEIETLRNIVFQNNLYSYF